jgi:spore coat polysaccharide biosynthesis protein SpsF (cytidylyltransferase family)
MSRERRRSKATARFIRAPGNSAQPCFPILVPVLQRQGLTFFSGSGSVVLHWLIEVVENLSGIRGSALF